MTGALLVFAGYGVLLAGVCALVRWVRAYDKPNPVDLRAVDDARADFEDRMHVVHAHNDGHVTTRRTMQQDWISIACSSGRHHLCRPDRDDCFCTCGHGGYDEAKAVAS